MQFTHKVDNDRDKDRTSFYRYGILVGIVKARSVTGNQRPVASVPVLTM